MTSQKFFFRFSLFPVLASPFARFENFSPIWPFWIFTFFIPRNNSEWWQAKSESCIPGWPDSQTDDEREKMNPLDVKMAEIWSTEGSAAPPKTTIKWQRRESKKMVKKNWVFPKNEGVVSGSGKKYFNRRSALRMHIFRLYIAAMSTLVFDGQMQKTGISVTFGRFEAFPDLWRHTYREFMSVIIDLAYRPNETFCSRTHKFGSAR